MGDYAEYLGTWRDDWGTYRSVDAYSHDNGLREVETIIAQLTNDQGEPGYAIITNWTGQNADRHEMLQDRSYAYIWMRDDWGQHIGATASNITGLDDIGTVQQGEDGVIDVLDRYEGTGSDTHEVWNQYSSAYNWTRDALYIKKASNGHKYGIGEFLYEGIVLDADGNIISLMNGTLPSEIEQVERGMTRALFTLKHNDHSHQVWIYFSAAYKDNQPLENGELDGSTYEEDWVTFKASDKHGTITVDLSLLDVKEIASIEEMTEEHQHHTHTYYQKVVGGAEVQIKRTHEDKWEIADLATVDSTQVYEWKYSNNLYQAYLNMTDNNYDGGAYRDLLGSYEGAYATAETELSGRVVGEIEDISNATTNDGTREFLGYTWNQNGTEYQENWQHYSDWYKDFSVGGQAVKSIYDAYVPSIDEQNATQLIDIWQNSYTGLYTNAEGLIKPIGTIETPISNELYPYTGIKTLISGEWDNGMYHEIWYHESDEYRHYLAPESRTSTYDKITWEDAPASHSWEQVWVGSHLQDQGWYEDNGSWYEQANVNANHENPIGQGNNDQWVQNLTWISNLIHIDDFESRIHTNNDLLYNWHDLLDDRAHYQYRVTTVTEETDQGEVQPVKEQLSEAIEGTVVSLTAGGDVILSTQIETLNAEITGQGGLYITELDALVLEEILNADGLIEITAVDELIVWKQIKAAHGSINLTSESDIEVIGEIIAQGTGAKIALTTTELVVIEGQIKAQDRIEIKAVGTNRVLSIYVKGIVETDPAGSMRLQGDKEILISGQLGTETVDHIEVVTEQNLYLLSEGQIKAQRVELEAWGEIEEVNYQNPERGQRLFIHPVTQQHLRLGTDGQQTEIPSILWVETNWDTTHGVQIDQGEVQTVKEQLSEAIADVPDKTKLF